MKALLERLKWSAFKMCGRGEHEDAASDVMTDAIARITALEDALKPFADSVGIEQNGKLTIFPLGPSSEEWSHARSIINVDSKS